MKRFLLCLALVACSYVPQAGQAPSPSPSTTPIVLDTLGQTILTYNNQPTFYGAIQLA